MNALELADELIGVASVAKPTDDGVTYGLAGYCIKAATMLRQQADRIKELEKDLALKTRDRDVFKNFTLAYEERIAELENKETLEKKYEKRNVELQQIIKRYSDRIAELEKDLAKYDELAIDDLKGRGVVWCACGDSITPDSGAVCGNCACTNPADLTDEEILALWTEKNNLNGAQDIVDFAKAILRKAQEK